MDFRCERGVIEATDHLVCLVLSFRPHLELLQLLRTIHRLPVIVEDGCGIQRFGVYLVTVAAQPNDDGVGVEYDLHILGLLDVTVRALDGVRDEMVSEVWSEPQRDLIAFDLVAPLIQWEARGGSRIRSLIWIVRIFECAYEWVLSWVEVLIAHVAGGAAPWPTHCWCTDWCSASCAAIFVLLLATALANCSSLHVEHTF